MERARFNRRPRKGKAERALQVRMAIECEAVAAGLSASKHQECKIVHDLFDFVAIDDIVRVAAWSEVVTRFFSSGSSGATGAANGDAVPGQFDVALNGPQKAIVRSALKASGAEGPVRGTLQSIAGPEFSSRELRVLEERVLDAATWNEAGRLWTIEGGRQIVVSPDQKAALDAIFGRLGDDELARKARGAYERTMRNGQVKVR